MVKSYLYFIQVVNELPPGRIVQEKPSSIPGGITVALFLKIGGLIPKINYISYVENPF
jgi:hypothetical protein